MKINECIFGQVEEELNKFGIFFRRKYNDIDNIYSISIESDEKYFNIPSVFNPIFYFDDSFDEEYIIKNVELIESDYGSQAIILRTDKKSRLKRMDDFALRIGSVIYDLMKEKNGSNKLVGKYKNGTIIDDKKEEQLVSGKNLAKEIADELQKMTNTTINISKVEFPSTQNCDLFIEQLTSYIKKENNITMNENIFRNLASQELDKLYIITANSSIKDTINTILTQLMKIPKNIIVNNIASRYLTPMSIIIDKNGTVADVIRKLLGFYGHKISFADNKIIFN